MINIVIKSAIEMKSPEVWPGGEDMGLDSPYKGLLQKRSVNQRWGYGD